MASPFDRFGSYRKAVVAVVGAAFAAAGVYFGVDSTVYQLLVAGGTILGVYVVPNA